MHVAPLVKLKATGKTVSPPTYRRSATPLQPPLYSHPFPATPLHPFTPESKAERSNTWVFTDNFLKAIN